MTYLTTTLSVDELQEIDKPDTVANHFSYELKTDLAANGVAANILEFTNKEYNQLHIQLICKESHQADKVDMAMMKLTQYYSFRWGYVSNTDHTLVASISGRSKVINIDVMDISFLEESA